MSSSVMVARTRMWRRMVAIMRGGNFCGAAWQRPQLARKRCSPATRMASASVLWDTGAAEAASLPLAGDPAKTDEASARAHRAQSKVVITVFARNAVVMAGLRRAQVEPESGTRSQN